MNSTLSRDKMLHRSNIACFSGALVLCCTLASSVSYGRNDDPVYACEKDGTTRYVEVVQEPGFACRVKYNKPSGTSYPWNARNEADYCGPKATALVKKLGTLGWQCYSDEDVHSVLSAQLERYGRFMKILSNVGKTCNFYPSEAQFGNLCGDERQEAVIVYTCEADTDRWNQYMAVFLEIESEPLVEEIGASGYRQVSAYYIDDMRVMIESEKLDSAEDASATQYPPEKTSIQCSYSADSKWKLTEK
jgi:hypothetical protein